MVRRRKSRKKRLTKRRWPIVVAVLVLAALVFADRSGWLLVPDIDDVQTYDNRTARVVRVIDGDTIEIAIADELNSRRATRVRLWGIDAPEIGRAGAPSEPFAEASRAFLAGLIEGKFVAIRLEDHRTRDEHDRLLAHLELPDGSNINRELLKAGLAAADHRTPHRHLNWYEQGELIARRAKAGIWSEED